MEDFDEESFVGADLTYSSFTYRIAAIRNLGRVLASPARQMLVTDEPAIDRVDAYLVNWKLHLPESKKTAITNDGQLDEMLFQAHMISEASVADLRNKPYTDFTERQFSSIVNTRNLTRASPKMLRLVHHIDQSFPANHIMSTP